MHPDLAHDGRLRALTRAAEIRARAYYISRIELARALEELSMAFVMRRPPINPDAKK